MMLDLVRIDGEAYLEPFMLKELKDANGDNMKRGLVIVIPGGAYKYCSDRESSPIAHRFNAANFHSVVLRYTVLPEKLDLQTEFLIDQVRFVLDWAEEHKDEYHIDMTKVSVIGFSAGGHLASWASIRLHDRIESCLLVYGAIAFEGEQLEAFYAHEMEHNKENYSEEDLRIGQDMVRLFADAPIQAIHEQVPRTFLFTTMADTTVPGIQSLQYASSLFMHGVPCELHAYQSGSHGLSLADDTTSCHPEQNHPRVKTWMDLAISWLKEEGITP